MGSRRLLPAPPRLPGGGAGRGRDLVRGALRLCGGRLDPLLACRAGTETPFAFGEGISTEQVNYGIAPSKRSPDGEYRETTIAVDALQPNGFGLHEIHGNVRELCRDEWVRYEENPQLNATSCTRLLSGERILSSLRTWLSRNTFR